MQAVHVEVGVIGEQCVAQLKGEPMPRAYAQCGCGQAAIVRGHLQREPARQAVAQQSR